MSDICTGIEDRGPHSVNLGENECPRCRIKELELQLMCVSDGSAMHVMQLEAKLDAVQESNRILRLDRDVAKKLQAKLSEDIECEYCARLTGRAE